MNPEQQRIAIAEACGVANRWLIVKRGLYYRPHAKGYTGDTRDAWIVSEEEADKHVYPHDEPVTKKRAPLPDYLNDLNAMHEAEKVTGARLLKFPPSAETGDPTWFNYVRMLTRVSQSQGTPVYHASAAQRAEAFLKTIGKWIDSEPSLPSPLRGK